jgi:hypothetical protein
MRDTFSQICDMVTASSQMKRAPFTKACGKMTIVTAKAPRFGLMGAHTAELLRMDRNTVLEDSLGATTPFMLETSSKTNLKATARFLLLTIVNTMVSGVREK